MLKSWIFLGAMAVLATGCVTGVGVGYRGPVVESDMYMYDYYPESEVYYSPYRHAYYYYEQDRWATSPSMPPERMSGASVSLEIRDEQPYKMHSEHRKRYPGHRKEH